MTIGTLEGYKTHRAITAIVWDNLIEQKLLAANGMAKRICNRSFESATFTEKYDGNGNAILILNQHPVSSITSITITSPAGSSYVVPASSYSVDNSSGIVKRFPLSSGRVTIDEDMFPVSSSGDVACFPRGHQNITVVYVAGYGEIPPELEEAIYCVVDYLVAPILFPKSEDDVTKVDYRKSLAEKYKGLLQPFKRYPIG